MSVIPVDGMNHPAEGLSALMSVAHDFESCQISLDRVYEECNREMVANGLVHIRHCHQVTQFIIAEPSRLLGLPYPAPPPKHHYSTWWRSITRRVYQASASSSLKKLRADMQNRVQSR